MTQKTLRTVGIAVLGVALACAAVVYSITQQYRITDDSPESLQNMVIHAVVDVTVDGEVKTDSRFDSNNLWSATINDVLWDRGDYTIVGGEKANLGLPEAGATIDISIPREVSAEKGSRYVIGLTRAYFSDPKEQATWPWQFRVALDPATDFRPVGGTSELVLTELDWVKREGESRADALVAYAAEWAAVLEARMKGTAEPDAPRLTALSEGAAVDSEREFAEWYASLDDRSRQLPQFLDELPAQAREKVGADSWGDWAIVVLFDEAVAKEVGSLAVYFPGSGILGPYEISSEESVTQINGVGPIDSAGELIWWPDGIPSEIIYRPEKLSSEETVRLVVSETTNLTAGPGAEGPLLKGGGTWLIDLREGNDTAEPLSDEEYRALFEELAPPEGEQPRSELDLPTESN
ncbi:MAG: hypothetical protein GY926_13045 [bacterium]|nr:hypothetical protein [bacterium]